MRRNDSALIHTLPGGTKVKRCAGCKQPLELHLFSKGTGPGGYHRHCRQCQKAWRAKHPAKPKETKHVHEESLSGDAPNPLPEAEVVAMEARPHPRWLSPLLDR